MSETITRMLVTPTVLHFDSILEEQPFSFSSFDELLKALLQASKAANRCNLYACYLIGKAADKDMLLSKYNISMTEFAEKLGVSRASIYNYRTLAELFTRKEIIALANMSVPLKALLVLGEARNALGDDAMYKLKNAIMCGDIKSLKSVKQEYQQLLSDSLAPYNLIPGSDAPEQQMIENSEDEDTIEVSPEDAIIKSDTDRHEDIEDAEEVYDEPTASLNEKDAKNAMKLITSTVGSLIKNYLDITNNADNQIMCTLDKQNVVINTTFEDAFDRVITELCESNQAALEVCLKMHEVFKRYGYVRRKTEIPENTSPEDLLGFKGREEGC